MSEEIYLNLKQPTDPESVHLCNYPCADTTKVDTALEQSMDEVVNIVSLGRAVRAETMIKNRQPLAHMYVYTTKPENLDEDMLEIIKDDLNVKQIEFIVDTAKYITFELKPQLKTLGPKYGKLLGGIRNYLSNCDSQKLVNKLNLGETQTFDVDGTTISLTLDDVLVNAVSKPNFKAQSQGGLTVILDTVLTPELIDEGIMREVVSKLQSMRKEAGFEVEDKINLYYAGEQNVECVVKQFEATIKTNVLIEKMQNCEGGAVVKDFEINGQNIKLGIERI